MRQKRAKTYRKLMAQYSMTFGFRQPYQVLVDSHMCSEAISSKLELLKQFETVLQGSVKIMITQCSIHELYLQRAAAQPATDLAKTFERRKCNHREPIAGNACIASVVGESNKHRYVVASQSFELRQELRRVPGVPLVHVSRSVVILEPPSDATTSAKDAMEREKLGLSASEMDVLGKGKERVSQPRVMRKKPKEPNPLSVRKRKPKAVSDGGKPKAVQRRQTHDSEEALTTPNAGQALVQGATGQKRNRPTEHDEPDGAGPGLPAASDGPSSPKRKRRHRKPKQSDTPRQSDALPVLTS